MKTDFAGKSAALAAFAMVGLGLWGCVDDHGEDPTLHIVSPANNGTVTGPDFLVRVQTADFEYAGGAPAAKASAAYHEGGHVHIYLDHELEVDANANTIETGDTITLVGITPGIHFLIAQGANTSHVPFPGMRDSVSFTVQ